MQTLFIPQSEASSITHYNFLRHKTGRARVLLLIFFLVQNIQQEETPKQL